VGLPCTSVCGDARVVRGEECDEGPASSDERPGACRTDCTLAGCGDAVVDPGEVCDPGDGPGAIERCTVLCGTDAGAPPPRDGGPYAGDAGASWATDADPSRGDAGPRRGRIGGGCSAGGGDPSLVLALGLGLALALHRRRR
jgi:MYXO-CTERM domain-containing protein